MRYLPVSIDTKDKNFLVIGAGKTAYEKILRLMDSQARIYIIGEDISPEIKELQIDNPDRIFIKQQIVNDSFIFFAYDYVIIATNNLELNDALEMRARKSGIAYMRSDGDFTSSFKIGNYITNGEITIALYDGLNNPPLEDKITDDLQRLIDSYNMDKFKILSQIRKTLLRRNSPNVDSIIKELYDREKISVELYLKDLNKSGPADKDLELVNDIVNENVKLEDIKNSEKKGNAFTDELKEINDARQKEEEHIQDEISDLNKKSSPKELEQMPIEEKPSNETKAFSLDEKISKPFEEDSKSFEFKQESIFKDEEPQVHERKRSPRKPKVKKSAKNFFEDLKTKTKDLFAYDDEDDDDEDN